MAQKQLRQNAGAESNAWSDYVLEALRVLVPPERLTVTEWADKYRILDSMTASMPGRWTTSLTPYLAGIMDEYNNPYTEDIIFAKATQLGGSEALINILLSIVHLDPSSTVYMMPSEKLAKATSTLRVQPALRATPELAERFREDVSEMLSLMCAGMTIRFIGGHSVPDTSSISFKNVFVDEVDKFPEAQKREADAVTLLRERSKTFHDRKFIITSTPTTPTGRIWREMENADVIRHYFVPCPHCGTYIELQFRQLKYPNEESGLSFVERAELAIYECQECGALIHERDKPRMLRGGEWRDIKGRTAKPKSVAFWLNTMYSPFAGSTWSAMVLEFLRAMYDPDIQRLKNFKNSWLAEPWEEIREKLDKDAVLNNRADESEFEIPEWAEMLTAGIDVQRNSVYWTIRAWGAYMTSQCIAYGQALSLEDLSELMDHTWERPDGEQLMVLLGAIDSGDGETQEMVYDYCYQHSDWAIPVKGSSRTLQGGPVRLSTVNKSESKADGMPLLIIDTNQCKNVIAARMKRALGRGCWMVHADTDEVYATQVTNEHVVVKARGGIKADVWEPKTKGIDNHYLDCEVYAYAAAEIKGVRQLFIQTEQQQQNEQQQESQSDTNGGSWINGGWR